MLNPFMGQTIIDSMEELSGRDQQIAALKGYMKKRSNAVLFGPEGSGKSTLLRCFFSNDYRRQMAREKTLVFLGEFPKGMSGEDVYGYFADSIQHAVKILRFCGMRDTMNEILESLNDIQYDSKQSRFDQSLDTIIMFGYRMVLVLDNFENFTSSWDIKKEHHDLLCGLLNDYKLQMITATNFDFNKTSLPPGTKNSTLLSRLNPNKVDVPPLSLEECGALLEQTLEDEGGGFRFTREQTQMLYDLSGGIPLLLNLAARYAFDALSGGEADWQLYTRGSALRDAAPVLKRWCKIMTQEQLSLLSELPRKGEYLTEDEEIAAKALVARGILQGAYFIDRTGKRKSADGYRYNSGLLEDFCQNREWMEEAAESNPLNKEEDRVVSFDPSTLLGGGQGTIHIEKVEIHNGDKIENKYQPTIIAGGFDKLFDILDLGKDQLGLRLSDMFQATVPPVIDAEQTAERISAMFIPEEVESEDPQGFEQEKKTLESRFQAVRAKVDPNLDDELLDSLSAKCRLYLQIAFVVDDALSVLDDFKLGDLSAQMVMYGKVLEQQLRDNLYRLFHQDEELKYVDPYTKQVDRFSKNTFAAMTEKKTCIGNYLHIIQAKDTYLQTLCESNQVCFGTSAASAQWWNRLGRDVDDARELRNRTDHAGSETDKANLEKMRDLLFGGGQILRRCAVGGDLTRKLWTLAPAGTQTPADDRVSWIGRTATMVDVEITSRGSIRGAIEGSGYGVSISPKYLAERGFRGKDFLGQKVPVRITRWDEGAQKFNAEIL